MYRKSMKIFSWSSYDVKSVKIAIVLSLYVYIFIPILQNAYKDKDR